jgi:hypothetical protein
VNSVTRVTAGNKGTAIERAGIWNFENTGGIIPGLKFTLAITFFGMERALPLGLENRVSE